MVTLPHLVMYLMMWKIYWYLRPPCCWQNHLIYCLREPTLCSDSRSIWGLMTSSVLLVTVHVLGLSTSASKFVGLNNSINQQRSRHKTYISWFIIHQLFKLFFKISPSTCVGWARWYFRCFRANDNLVRNGSESGFKSLGHDVHCRHMERHPVDCIRNQRWISTENPFQGSSWQKSQNKNMYQIWIPFYWCCMAVQPIKLREKFGCCQQAWLSQPCPIPVDRIHVNMIFKSLMQPPWKEPEGDLQVCLGKLYLRRRRVQPSTIWWCGPLGRTLQSAPILRANYGGGEGTK